MITKTTDKYSFHQENGEYVLNFGTIKKGDDTSTDLLLEGYNNPTLTGGCSCVKKEKKVLEDSKVKYTLKYTLCERSILKTLEDISNNIKIKIIGKCV